MKKQLLPLLAILSLFGSVSATETVTTMTSLSDATMSTVLDTASGSMLAEREAFQKQVEENRAKNKALRSESKGSLQAFRANNSGSLIEMKKSNTGAIRDAIKKTHDERKNYIASLSGMTLEMKAQYMSGLEDRIKTEVETRFQNASGSLLAKRMEVFVENATRRAETLMNQLQIRADRGSLRTAEIDALIAKITKELPNLSTEKKTLLAKKIDEKILKIQKNKRLPEASRTEIIAKLTSLRNEVMK